MKNDLIIQIEASQFISLKILDEIDRICKKYNINYFLDSGTLLGAVRNRGYIPWDDDIDILMHRKEFEKFKYVCHKELNECFFLQTVETDKFYTWFLPKVIYLNSRVIKNIALDKRAKSGIIVDIFIIDCIPNNKIVYKIWITVISFLHGMSKRNIQLKNFNSYNDKLKIIISRIFGSFIPKKLTCLLYNYISGFFNGKGKKNVAILNHSHYYSYKIYPAYFFSEPKEIEFESKYYPVPIGWHEYLVCLYGENYMIPPNKEEQKPHEIIYLYAHWKDKEWEYFKVKQNE